MNKKVIATLSLSALGLLGIASYEGYSDTAYVPVAGDKLTIGFGSTSDVKPNQTITVTEGLGRLYRDVLVAESAIHQCVRVPLSQGEYDAYTSLAFNIGNKAFCSSTLVKKLNGGDYEGACSEVKRWVYFKGQVLRGLQLRREYEYKKCMEDK